MLVASLQQRQTASVTVKLCKATAVYPQKPVFSPAPALSDSGRWWRHTLHRQHPKEIVVSADNQHVTLPLPAAARWCGMARAVHKRLVKGQLTGPTAGDWPAIGTTLQPGRHSAIIQSRVGVSAVSAIGILELIKFHIDMVSCYLKSAAA
jgi:hypothetical protein